MRVCWVLLLVAGVLFAGCSTVPDKETPEIAWGTALPDDARVQYEKAMDYLQRGRQKDAEKVVLEACQNHPKSQRLWFLCAILAGSRQEVEPTVQAFLKVRELEPRSILGTAARLIVDNEIPADEQMARLEKLIDKNPDEMLLRWLYAMESNRLGICLEEGAAQFEAILQAWNPAPVMVHHTYATLLSSRMDLPGKALEHQQLAAEMEPNAQTYYRLAFILYLVQRYEESDQLFEKVVEMAPEDPIAWFQWGNCLAYKGNFEAAAEKFMKASKLGTVTEVSLVCWGRCLERLGYPELGYDKYAQARARSGLPGGLADSYVAIAKLYGYGTACDFEGAVEIFAVQGGGPAIGVLREQVQEADKTDNPLAPECSDVLLKHLTAKAEGNDADAQYSMAMIYRHGIGVGKDAEASKKWLKRAAENGHEIAARMLAPTK
ncbi:MAG: SEL1-like repeat protein [Pontiellaceae bacterium]|nr:SEL1-like repeat protein [Pontiellaceae bacterium]